MESVRRDSKRGIWKAIGGFFLAAIFIMISVFVFLPMMTGSQIMQIANQSMMSWTVSISYGIGYFMLVVTGIFVFLVLLSTIGRKLYPVAVDRIIQRMPYYRDIVLSKNNFIIFHGLSLLVKTGVSMEKSFTIISGASGPGALRADLLTAAKQISKGQPWVNSIRSLEPTDRAALGASQDREEIAVAMGAISQQYQDIYAQRMGTFVPMMDALAVILLTLSGFIMFATSMLPMLQVSATIIK